MGWPYAMVYFGSGSYSLRYCDIFGQDADNFAGPGIHARLGTIVGVTDLGDSCEAYSNIFLNSFLNDAENHDLVIAEDSPCLGAEEGGVDIGAFGIGSEPQSPAESATWSDLKALYRQ